MKPRKKDNNPAAVEGPLDLLEMEKKLLAYRKKHFKAQVGKPYGSEDTDEITLQVTHNGYQWSSISFLPHELKKTIKVLQAALEKYQKKAK